MKIIWKDFWFWFMVGLAYQERRGVFSTSERKS